MFCMMTINDFIWWFTVVCIKSITRKLAEQNSVSELRRLGELSIYFLFFLVLYLAMQFHPFTLPHGYFVREPMNCTLQNYTLFMCSLKLLYESIKLMARSKSRRKSTLFQTQFYNKGGLLQYNLFYILYTFYIIKYLLYEKLIRVYIQEEK